MRPAHSIRRRCRHQVAQQLGAFISQPAASHSPSLMDQSHLLTHAAISCTASTVTGTLAQPARTTRRSFRQPAVVVTQLLLQEAGDHVPHISENFYTYTDGNDLAILLNKDTFVSGAAVFSTSETSTSKDKWGYCCKCRTWLATTPIRCRLSHRHVLLSPPSQQSRQET